MQHSATSAIDCRKEDPGALLEAEARARSTARPRRRFSAGGGLRSNPAAWMTAVGWLLLAPVGHGQDLQDGAFRVAREKSLRVEWQGRPLIARDSIDYTAGFDQAEAAILTRQEDRQVLNVTQSRGAPVSYRKEVAVGPEGVELTVKYRLPAYRNDPARPNIRYAFYVPLAAVRDATWKACLGRARATEVKQGKAGSALSGIRSIAFRSERVRLVFDFDPQGVTAGGDYCSYGEPVGSWSMAREGEFLVFSFGYRAAFHGGVFMGKCVIREGDYDYDARHAWRKWGYRGPTLPATLFAFGTARPPKEATAADTTPYSRERGHGWRRNEGLTLVRGNPTGVVNNCLRGAGGEEGAFLVDLVPGHWLATVRIAPGREGVGPMEIRVNGRRVAEGLMVAAGGVHTLTAPVVHRGAGPLELAFRGTRGWAVSSLALQPLLYQSEDFVFDRGWWHVEGVFTP